MGCTLDVGRCWTAVHESLAMLDWCVHAWSDMKSTWTPYALRADMDVDALPEERLVGGELVASARSSRARAVPIRHSFSCSRAGGARGARWRTTGPELRLIPVIEQVRDQLKRTVTSPGAPTRYDAEEVVDLLRARFREYERQKRIPLRGLVERGMCGVGAALASPAAGEPSADPLCWLGRQAGGNAATAQRFRSCGFGRYSAPTSAGAFRARPRQHPAPPGMPCPAQRLIQTRTWRRVRMYAVPGWRWRWRPVVAAVSRARKHPRAMAPAVRTAAATAHPRTTKTRKTRATTAARMRPASVPRWTKIAPGQNEISKAAMTAAPLRATCWHRPLRPPRRPA